MNQDALALIDGLVEHVEQQRQKRVKEGYKPSVQPPKEVVAERKAILDKVVNALGIPLKELQVKLGVNRTTWERWERMESIPKKSHLDYLRRLMQDAKTGSALAADQQPLPGPYEFIGASPRTYGQLRVLFSHRAYKWEDAIFHFQTPFQDAGYILDLASLALNGCKVVYMMKDSKLTAPNDWSLPFAKNMKDALGVRIASQVLACLCIVVISDGEESLPSDFGVLNFESIREGEKVGYIWVGKQEANSSALLTQPNQYQPIPASDDCFDMLRLRYREQLSRAFQTIGQNRAQPVLPPPQYFDKSQNKYKFTIPVIDKEVVDQNHKSKALPIYV